LTRADGIKPKLRSKEKKTLPGKLRDLTTTKPEMRRKGERIRRGCVAGQKVSEARGKIHFAGEGKTGRRTRQPEKERNISSEKRDLRGSRGEGGTIAG